MKQYSRIEIEGLAMISPGVVRAYTTDSRMYETVPLSTPGCRQSPDLSHIRKVVGGIMEIHGGPLCIREHRGPSKVKPSQ